MKVVVDAEACIGCELCVQTCPEVYRMEDDKAVVFVNTVSPDVESVCQQAVDECPVQAIKVNG